MPWQVRTSEEGWLQGFITVTTFTTWHNDFRWDSLCTQAGLRDASMHLLGTKFDDDGSLAQELNSQVFSGNPQVPTDQPSITSLPGPQIFARCRWRGSCGRTLRNCLS